MFSEEDLKCFDKNYFAFIVVSDYDVTIMSKNTGHMKYIHNPGDPCGGSVVIFHKHKA